MLDVDVFAVMSILIGDSETIHELVLIFPVFIYNIIKQANSLNLCPRPFIFYDAFFNYMNYTMQNKLSNCFCLHQVHQIKLLLSPY